MAAKPAPKLHLFVSNRDIVLHSIQGHSIAFEKGIPTHVPRALHSEAMEKGILPVDDKGESLPAGTVPDPKPIPVITLSPEDPADRVEAIKAACEAIYARNSSTDFNAGGAPTSKAVTAALGWKVEAKEIAPIWQEIKIAANAQK